MTMTDAFQRDRLRGPKEAVYARHGTRLTWTTAAVLALALLVWIYIGTNEPPLRGDERLTAMLWASVLTLAGFCLLAARLVIGTLRGAAEAAGE